MTEKYDVEWVQLFGKEINLIIILFNEQKLTLEKLAEKLEITNGYMSRRIKPLVEQGIVLVDRGEPSGGRPPHLIRLSYKTRQILDQMIKTSNLSNEKKEIPDIDNFNKLLDLLLCENEVEHVADLVHITSSVHCIPVDSYYFQFIAKHLPSSIPVERIRVILDSTKNFVSGMSELEKTQVYESLEPCLRKILGTKYSDNRRYGIHKAAKELLDQLDLQNLTYEQLEKRYLASIQDELGHPEFYRDIILSEHRDRIFNLWLKAHELTKLQDPLVSSRAEVEKSLLR